jgi:cytochrome c-type biogenesis protein CcmF
VIVIMIGFAGAAFNQDKEQEMGYGDQMKIGPYTLVCRSYTQDDNPNYGSEWAVMDVFEGGRQIATLNPERRFYKASQTASTMVANRSTLKEDLYLVYEGQNPTPDGPFSRCTSTPLVMWIWIGVWIMLVGTVVGLIPNAGSALPELSAAAPWRGCRPEPIGAGD